MMLHFFIYNCCKDNFYFSDYTTFYPTFFVDLTIYLLFPTLLLIPYSSYLLQYSFLLSQDTGYYHLLQYSYA